MRWTVGQVARHAGVSVRTLHHYDTIGLLRPAGRSAAGYRHYDRADLERLQRILTYRSLGMGLAAIAEALDRGDDRDPLTAQLAQLDRRLAHLRDIRRTILTTLEARTMGIELTPDELLDVFGDEDPSVHAAEAEARWGDTEAWAASQRRTRRYGKDDWNRIRDEADAIEAAFAEALASGAPVDGSRARELAEAHRRHIDRWFYPCSPAMHRGLAAMYTSDERFREHYDRRAAGLAAYVAQAIDAQAQASSDAAANGDTPDEKPPRTG